MSQNHVANTYGLSTDATNAVQNVGIHVISCTNTVFSANRVVDIQGSATQYYPFYFFGSATGIMSVANHNAGNLGGVTDITTGVSTIINSTTGSLRFDGGSGRLGFYGATPVVKPTGTPPASTDLATAIALANDLRSKLVAIGLIS